MPRYGGRQKEFDMQVSIRVPHYLILALTKYQKEKDTDRATAIRNILTSFFLKHYGSIKTPDGQ